MPKFTLPLNWQEDYFEKINFDGVAELYGKLREDFLGGGKSSMAQAEPSKKMVHKTVQRAHAMGIEVNYLLNATCIGNLEFTAKGYKQIRKTFDWLSTIEVDTVTVALPFIAQIAKKFYPHFKMNVSTQADVNSLEKAKYWEALGADVITLSHVSMNRNFDEIARITQNCRCDTQLIANMFCKRGCPYLTLHGNFNAHASQSWAKTNRYNVDYYFISCLANDFSDPLRVIQSNWIRPEDLAVYEQLGIKRFKIAERGLKSDALAAMIEAYRNGSHDGNLIDLVPSMSKYVFLENLRNYKSAMKELKRVSFVNVFKMAKMIKKLDTLRSSESYYKQSGLYIDNKKLDGAIQFFIDKGCMKTTCDGCDFCENLVKTAVTSTGEDLTLLKDFVDDLVGGYYF